MASKKSAKTPVHVKRHKRDANSDGRKKETVQEHWRKERKK